MCAAQTAEGVQLWFQFQGVGSPHPSNTKRFFDISNNSTTLDSDTVHLEIGEGFSPIRPLTRPPTSSDPNLKSGLSLVLLTHWL